MTIRRLLAAACATAGLSLVATPAASAQDLVGLDSLATGLIANASCDTVAFTLRTIDASTDGELVNENTTRNQLVRNLQALNNDGFNTLDPLSLAATRYSGKFADRALECKLVKEDTILTGGGSPLSSMISDFAPMLSSGLNQK